MRFERDRWRDGQTARRSAVAFVASAYALLIAAYHYYGHVDVDPPGGRELWYGGATVFSLVIVASIAVGVVIGRWWAPALSLALVVEQAWLAIRGVSGDFHDAYPPLEDPFLPLSLLALASLIAVGVALRKGGRRLARGAPPTSSRP